MAEEKDPSYTILEYMRDHSGYKCGYCKSKDTNFSHGMWAHRMAVGDYQDLIDRGWRRSGKYCYKPTMDKTCCPMYTIRCDATQLKLSKTQKKVMKRMHRYLSYGDVKKDTTEKASSNECPDEGQGNVEFIKPQHDTKEDFSSVTLKMPRPDTAQTCNSTSVNSHVENSLEAARVPTEATQEPVALKPESSPGSKNKGMDPSKPLCRKAKDIRRERREAKVAKRVEDAISRGESPMEIPKNKEANKTKTLEDFLNQPLPDNPAHKLELRLVRVNPPDAAFRLSYNSSYGVFRQYQVTIHHDKESECNRTSFQSFLVDGPLSPWVPSQGPQAGYGSFHHQYWLDGQLIAVGVLDVLPHCVSSVYLYYDPEFSFLSLGTYASLRELALTRELQQKVPSLKWYYMGFYIHSCPKMRYKGHYTPSFLLCPETYLWVPIENSAPKLEVNKYSRFNEDSNAVDENGKVELGKVLVLHEQELMNYETYQEMSDDADDEEEVREYATLVGAKNAYSMVLFRG